MNNSEDILWPYDEKEEPEMDSSDLFDLYWSDFKNEKK